MLKARWKSRSLRFRFEAGTSRGVLHEKQSWFLIVSDVAGNIGIGELNFIKGLSTANAERIPSTLDWFCDHINEPESLEKSKEIENHTLTFAIETAFADLKNGRQFLFGDTKFSSGEKGIPIHGLVWMGASTQMRDRMFRKLDDGFKVLKIKVGAIDFDEELRLLETLRNHPRGAEIELRLDANGAFQAKDAMKKLRQLAVFQIHSIEQPVKPADYDLLRELCQTSPIPVALDEQLIEFRPKEAKEQLLTDLSPSFLVLKPSLIGGFKQADEWVELAEKRGIAWWVSSALESNVGLNALAQWVASKNNELVQALGTGQLFSNNIPSPLELKNDRLFYQPHQTWLLDTLN